MSERTADVLIVGAGVMGCAAAYQLARDGARVLLFDRFAVGHDRGSSHGHSRIFRLALGPAVTLVCLRCASSGRHASARRSSAARRCASTSSVRSASQARRAAS